MTATIATQAGPQNLALAQPLSSAPVMMPSAAAPMRMPPTAIVASDISSVGRRSIPRKSIQAAIGSA